MKNYEKISKIMICLAKKEDALTIAELHKKEIKSGFLSSLPLFFLEKLYLAVIKNDFCIIAKENGEIVGFTAGTADIKKLYSYFFKKHFFYSALILFPKIFSLRKIMETLFYPKKIELKAELLTIAVKKEFQGRGIAMQMFKFFTSEMRKRRIKKFKVLVGGELSPAIRFYEKSGFKFLKQTEVHKGKKSRIYIYEL